MNLKKRTNVLKSDSIPIEELKLNHKIGSGQFGQVFKGVYQNNYVCLEVAIKV